MVPCQPCSSEALIEVPRTVDERTISFSTAGSSTRGDEESTCCEVESGAFQSSSYPFAAPEGGIDKMCELKSAESLIYLKLETALTGKYELESSFP